jgi:hypothetical protein
VPIGGYGGRGQTRLYFGFYRPFLSVTSSRKHLGVVISGGQELEKKRRGREVLAKWPWPWRSSREAHNGDGVPDVAHLGLDGGREVVDEVRGSVVEL